jgi:hypothetical protein
MTISSNFKCQLSFNWHLDLNKVCATQSWPKGDKTLLKSFRSVWHKKKEDKYLLTNS